MQGYHLRKILMRPLLFSILILVVARPAVAQMYYAEQVYPTVPQTLPQGQQQVSGNYYPNPSTTPQVPAPQQAQQPQPTPHYPQAQPWDYGQSVTTDIRQMNF